MLRDIIPEAKKAFRGGESGLMRRQTEKSSITADTPVPYRIADLLALIDERIGRLEGRNDKPHLRSLKVKIVSAINDPRYHFMFSSNTITDTIQDTIAKIFRIPGDGKPIATFELAGIPSEVVNSVASVLCRMAFEIGLWSNGGIHMLVVCEEAHRYVPADTSLGFLPTRQAIARIAKEGRKYGVSLGVITQRPGELDPTILSQCSTVFAMRLANDRDQEIIRSAIPNSSTSTTSFISSIGNGEAIAFGEAVAVPMRMRFSRISEERLPRAHGIIDRVDEDAPPIVDLRSIVSRMRSISGPDISGFQQSYMAAQSGSEERLWDAELGASAQDVAPDPAPHDEPPEIEPYRPDMLPRAAPAVNPELERFNLIRQQLLNEKPAAEQPAPRFGAAPPTGHGSPATGSDRPREGSLRESLLKRPLGSIIRKT
jgi:hypothetical protein